MSELRDLWVVDVETTGLDVRKHVPLEIAAVNVQSGEVISFVPSVRRADLAATEPEALAINRYYERRVWERQLGWKRTVAAYDELFDTIRGHTFGGANPRFDAAMVMRGYAIAVAEASHSDVEVDWGEPWHYRLEDVQSYAAAVMRLPLGDVPGLDRVCAFVGVENDGEHTALADARVTAECFRRLLAMQHETTSLTTEKEPTHA